MSRIANRTAVTVLGAAAAVVLLAACSSSGGTTTSAPAAGAPTGAAGGAGASGTGTFGSRAAASGEIAQISASTLQVQSSSAQTAVRYSAKTAFTITKSTTRSAVQVGSCVVASSTSATAANSASAIKAGIVRVSSPRNGTCSIGAPGGTFGGRPSGMPQGGLPSGAPGGAQPSGAPGGVRPSGAPGGTGGFGGFAAGTVTKISGSTLTVRMSRGGSGTTTRTVSLSSATKYTTTVRTDHKAAKVGQCAIAQGSTASNGTVHATSISLSAKTGGSCTTGFGGPRG